MRDGQAGGAATDRDLVQAFQGGDDDAYDEIFHRYSERVRWVCRRLLINPQDAEEAFQETFLKAYQALPRFNGRYQLGAWLNRIATNVCVDEMRVRGRTSFAAVPADEHSVDVTRGPEDIVAGERVQLDETFGELHPLHASALMMRAHEGLSHREIATRLAMSPDQVKALLHRARRSFRRAWEKAEAGLMAPVLLIREMFGRRAQDASEAGAHAPNIAAVGGSGSILVVERVAAASVIVAAALSGLSTAPPTETAPTPAVPGISAESPEARDALPGPLISAVSAGAAASATNDQNQALAAVEEIVEEVDDAVEPPNEPREDEPEDDENEGTALGNPGAAEKKVMREVRRVLEKLPKQQ
ncbi:MAG: RNA polymerase sigma factor [Actinomycetota bacterium]